MNAPGRARTMVAAMVVASAIAVAADAHASLPPTPAGWTLQWSDDFTGAANALPSSSNWIFTTGTQYPGGPAQFGTGEIQTYTTNSANIGLDGGGNLRITPVRDSAGQWTSSRIETQRTNFKPPSGGVLRIEGRIQMPNVTGAAAAGYWPAFWALGAPYRGNYWNWPGIGELDIMENVNGLNQVWGTLHCGVNPGGPCNETNGLSAIRACPNSACQGNFHTYAIEWDTSVSPNLLRWYVDGVQFFQVSQSQVGSYWSQMTDHQGYFILLNVAMGGGFPNGVAGSSTPTASTVSGRSMLVDYVAVYTRGGGGTGPARSAYSTIQAESYNAQNGVVPGADQIGYLASGDWARYDDVDFGSTPARDFMARVSSGAGGSVSGLVQVRLDSPSATPIGSFAIGDTGGWSSFREVPGNVSAVTGTHQVYLTFSSGQPADFVNVDWFVFRR